MNLLELNSSEICFLIIYLTDKKGPFSNQLSGIQTNNAQPTLHKKENEKNVFTYGNKLLPH